MRKRFPPWGCTVGKVVGYVGHWFQVIYEDGGYEQLSWYELRQILVPDAALDAALAAVDDFDGLCRTSQRRRQPRDLDQEAADYVPRMGCHHSLPPGHVACHLHEAMRLSGEYAWIDPGPEKSD